MYSYDKLCIYIMFLHNKVKSLLKHSIDTRHESSDQRKKTKGMTFKKENVPWLCHTDTESCSAIWK